MVKLESVISLKTGDSAPEFNLKGIDDKMHSLNDYSKKGLLIIFMCNHCPFVVRILAGFVQFAHEYMDKGVNVIAISSNDVVAYPMDGPKHMAKLAQEHGFRFPYLYDESQSVAKDYEAACTPDFALFDAYRRCVYRGQFDGARPGNDVEVTGVDMRCALDALIAGETVPAEGQIPSLGCNIKWKPE